MTSADTGNAAPSDAGMAFFRATSEVPDDFGPSAVTFGKFDGVHLGHRAVIDELRDLAAERSLVPTVLTFDRNPLALLAPARCPESITGLDQKAELLADAGVGATLEVPFDRAFSAQDAEQFIARIIVGTLHAGLVLVGPDTRFGAGGRGHFDTLVDAGAEYGFEVRQLAARTDATGRISSTRIRGLLSEGRVAEAATLLGRYPSVRAMVVHGQKRGRALGYPTANLAPDLTGFIPADGVYAGYLSVRDAGDPRRGIRMPAAISIGNNPTFEGVPARQVEAYVLDADLDLYDRVVEVEFVDRVRGMERFDSLDELIARMGLDTERVRELLPA